MENITTAAEFFRDCMEGGQSVYTASQRKFIDKAIEFTKMHNKLALAASAKNAKTKFIEGVYIEKTPTMWDIEIDKDSILNAYPEDNIK